MITREIWKPVIGFEESYDVSNMGRIRSYRRNSPPVLLRPGLTSAGYPSVALGRGNTNLVHKLVATAFLGLPKPGQEVRHKDGTRTNNHVDNLCWGSRSENNLDKRRHGTDLNGETNTQAKLTNAQVLVIRQQAGIISQRKLAKEFGVSPSLISCIIRKTKRCIA